MHFLTRTRTAGYLIILTASGTLFASHTAHAQGDAAEGKKTFSHCSACHSTKAGENRIGPSLAGIYGRKSGTEPGFNYSAAVKKLNVTWDEKTLDQWLQGPPKMARGTKMVYSVPDEKDREDLIAYLKTLK